MRTFKESEILERIEYLKKQNEKNTSEMLGLLNFLKITTPALQTSQTQTAVATVAKHAFETARKRFVEWFIARFPSKRNQNQETIAFFIFDNQYRGGAWLGEQFRKKGWVSQNTTWNNIRRITASLEELKKDIYL